MDRPQQLLGRGAGGRERLGRAGEVDERHPVRAGEQVAGDAEAGEVEPARELARDAARVRDRAGHADLRSGTQEHVPGPGVAVVAQLGAGGGERTRLCFAVDLEGQLCRKRDRSEHGQAGGVDGVVALQRPDADPCGDGARVARGELGLGDLGAGRGVDPAPAVPVALVGDEPAEPRQLEDRGRCGRAVDLEVEAGGGRAARAQLGGADDDDEVGRVGGELGAGDRDRDRARDRVVRSGARVRLDVRVARRQRLDGGLRSGRTRDGRVELAAPPRHPLALAQLRGERRDCRVQIADA
jgi:hypothetical protein